MLNNKTLLEVLFRIFISDSVCFDNTFSWTRAKKVYYEAEIITIDDEYVRSEINDLIQMGDWKTLEQRFETTHF